MDLAAHLGMTVGRLRREMTPREFALWRIKWNEEPWGEYRADLRNAHALMVLANIHRDKKKHPDVIPLETFLLFKRKPEEEEDSRRPRRATIAPETVSWLYAMAAKTEAKKQKDAAQKKEAKNGH